MWFYNDEYQNITTAYNKLTRDMRRILMKAQLRA